MSHHTGEEDSLMSPWHGSSRLRTNPDQANQPPTNHGPSSLTALFVRPAQLPSRDLGPDASRLDDFGDELMPEEFSREGIADDGHGDLGEEDEEEEASAEGDADEAEGEEHRAEEEEEDEDLESDTSSAMFDPDMDPVGWARRLDELAGVLEVGEREVRSMKWGPNLTKEPEVPMLSLDEFRQVLNHHLISTEWKYTSPSNLFPSLPGRSTAIGGGAIAGVDIHPIRVLGRDWAGRAVGSTPNLAENIGLAMADRSLMDDSPIVGMENVRISRGRGRGGGGGETGNGTDQTDPFGPTGLGISMTRNRS